MVLREGVVLRGGRGCVMRVAGVVVLGEGVVVIGGRGCVMRVAGVVVRGGRGCGKRWQGLWH